MRVRANEAGGWKGSTEENQAFERSAADCVLAFWRPTRPRAKRRAVVFDEGRHLGCAPGVVETHEGLRSRFNRRFSGVWLFVVGRATEAAGRNGRREGTGRTGCIRGPDGPMYRRRSRSAVARRKLRLMASMYGRGWHARARMNPRETGPDALALTPRGLRGFGPSMVRIPDVIECSAMPIPQTFDVEVQADALARLASAGPVQAVAE